MAKLESYADRKSERLIILEGPDCGGKTTLATELMKRLSNSVKIHHGPFPRVNRQQLPRFYLESMQPMLDRWHGLVMDRSWLSEQVYGPVFRGSNRVDDVCRRHLERIAMRHGAVVVLCLPPWEKVREKWAERKGLDPKAEMLENEDQLREVYDRYNKLETDLPVVRYDYTTQARHGYWIDHLLGEIKRVGSAPHPWAASTVGNIHSKVVLIGDTPSEVTDFDCLKQWPFSSFAPQGSSRWLTQQLIEAKIPESALLWVNQESGLYWLEQVWGRPVIALGQIASLAVSQLRWLENNTHDVAHPQHHKRFKAGEPYPLIPLLTKLIHGE